MRIAYCRPLPAEAWPAPGGAPAGWTVRAFDDNVAFEDHLRACPVDAALVRLPAELRALTEMLSRVRAASPGLPVIIAAGVEQEAAAVEAVIAGAADYWLDSMSPLRLRTALEQAVSRRRASATQMARDEALERVEDAVVVTDAGERIAYWNQAASRLYGYSYAEVVGRLLPDTLSPLWLDTETRLKAWRAVAARGFWCGETTHSRRDGSPVRVAMEISAARDGRGLRAGLLLVARPAGDAASRRASEDGGRRETRDARQFLERIINTVADPIFVKDREYRMVLVNDALCALVGRPREEILGKTDHEYLPKEQSDIFRRQDELVFQSGEENVNEELITGAKGETRVLITKKTLWRDTDGRAFLVGVIRDVTEMAKTVDDLKRSQEQLRHAQKLEAVGRLAGGVAHDFNNVLTAIVGCADILLETLPPGHPCRVEAQEIRGAGEQAAALTRQLLTFSRRDEGLPRVVDLREIFGGMRRMLGRLLPADIELEMCIPDRLGTVRVDPSQAEQVLLNLVVNAGDAMPSGGKISVVLNDEPGGGGGLAGPCVRLTVSDNGLGMDESTRARIFEPFFTTKSHGTGIGLATVRDVVSRSGGRVVVESAPERGASFHVYWPRCADPPDAEDREAPAAARRAPRRARVLIAEDDDAVRRFSVRCLERAGYDVLAAADGAEALRLSDSHEGLFDVVIIDVVLPRIRGTDVAQRLRARQPTARILFTSGYRSEAAGLPKEAIGPARFLQKPFTAAALAETVREMVEPAVP